MKTEKLIHSNSLPYFFAVIVAICYSVASLSIPFFSDMSYISSIANQIYHSNFHEIINTTNDNGTPPLYSLFFSIIWKMFSYKLWLSHLAVLPIFLGLLYQYYVLSSRFLSQKATFIALIFILIDPIFITQFMLMGYDIVLVFLFLLAINSIYKKQHILLIISTILIPLINIRGFSILLSIFAIHIYINKAYSIKSFIRTSFFYIPAILSTLMWYLYHYSQTAWLVVSPENTALHHINSVVWTIKNMVFEIIAFNSNGRFIVLFFVLLLFILNRDNFFKAKNKELIILISLSLLPFILIFTALHYPTGPRYFMIVYPFVYILFVSQMHKLSLLKQKVIIIISISGLFISNFWVNPYPYSNAWDSSLKVMSYFKIQKEMLIDFKKANIKGEEVISGFPLHKDMAYNYQDTTLSYKFSEQNKEIKEGQYIIYSNIYNNLELRKQKPSYSNLTLYKEYHYYPSWIKIYRKE